MPPNPRTENVLKKNKKTGHKDITDGEFKVVLQGIQG